MLEEFTVMTVGLLYTFPNWIKQNNLNFTNRVDALPKNESQDFYSSLYIKQVYFLSGNTEVWVSVEMFWNECMYE